MQMTVVATGNSFIRSKIMSLVDDTDLLGYMEDIKVIFWVGCLSTIFCFGGGVGSARIPFETEQESTLTPCFSLP